MVFNYGPRGANGEHIDFNPGIGGGKFDPLEHFEIKFNENDPYQSIKFYEDESSVEKDYYELKLQGDNLNKWYIKFLKNCFINLKKPLKNCEIFMVGKGSKGETGSGDNKFSTGDSNQGGKGGNGGKIYISSYDIKLDNKEYSILIQNNSSIVNNDIALYSSENGNNNNGIGGSGAIITSHYDAPSTTPANEGGPGILKYGIYYGAGGGGGGVARYYSSSSGSSWVDPTTHTTYYYQTASTDGANGGGKNNDNDYSGGHGGQQGLSSGKINTGSGGGGAYQNLGTSLTAGEGSYGTIIISN